MSAHLCQSCTDVLSELFSGLRSAAQGWVTVQRKGTFPDAWSCHLCANLCTQAENAGHVYDGNDWTVPDVGIDACYLLEPSKENPGQTKLYVEFYIGSKLESFTARIVPDSIGTKKMRGFTSSPVPLVSSRNASTGRVSTCNESALSFLRRKLMYCIDNHPDCRQDPVQRKELYPYRLLDVRSNGSTRVKLVDTTSRNKITSRYLTLSHCWGSTPVKSLTRDTEPSLRSGVLVADLPRTFRQAVEVAQYLGIRYLWVDSLCIFQDKINASDWQEQSSYMGSIYASGLCNIAASNASDSMEGLEGLRYPLSAIPFRICLKVVQPEFHKANRNPENMNSFIVYPVRNYYEDVRKSVLNQRAWVLQERFLSSCIMHFGARDIYLECRRNTFSGISQRFVRQGDIEEDLGESRLKILSAQMNEGDDNLSQTWSPDMYSAWSKFLTTYSHCKLTYSRDKLVAINGIAELVAQRTNDEFFCGLWRRHLLQQLLWRVDSSLHRAREEEWLAPTWSWASLKNSAIFHASYRPSGESKERVRIEHASMERLPSGQLTRASLVLNGKIAAGTLYMSTDGTRRTIKRIWIRYDLTGHTRNIDFGKELDELDEWPPERLGWDWNHDTAKVKVICMAVFEHNWEELGGDPSTDRAGQLGILILTQSGEEESYERIGITLLPFGYYKDHEMNETPDSYSIALV